MRRWLIRRIAVRIFDYYAGSAYYAGMKTPQQIERDRERTRAWKKAHPERTRQLNAESLARCPRVKSLEERQRDVQRATQWAKDNPDRAAVHRRAQAARQWRVHTPAVRKRYRRWVLKTKYGLTQEQYDAKLAAQNGGCCICETKEPGGRGVFPVDHDHETGVIRGLLCDNCNNGLGRFQDNPEFLRRAATYLEFDRGVTLAVV